MKKKKPDKPLEIPSIAQLEVELGREKYRHRFRRVLRSTVYALITVAAAAVLVATLWMPVLQISGNSMSPPSESWSRSGRSRSPPRSAWETWSCR